VPCEKEIHFYERETWLCKFKIDLSTEISSDFVTSILEFSPCGKYILATTNTQMIYVFSIINKATLFKYSYNKKLKLCALGWNPVDHSQLIFCDVEGNMGNIKVTINDLDNSSSKKSPVKSKNTKKTAEENLGKSFIIISLKFEE